MYYDRLLRIQNFVQVCLIAFQFFLVLFSVFTLVLFDFDRFLFTACLARKFKN